LEHILSGINEYQIRISGKKQFMNPMIETIALSLLIVFTLYYISFITRVRTGLLSLKHAPAAYGYPMVSIIIAARDEAASIHRCLQSLVRQTYPSTKYEIIIVDDGSSDSTASIVKDFSKDHANVRLLSIAADSGRRTGCKPLAITYGIEQSSGEIILTTDADCIAPPRWIEIMMNYFDEHVVFVAGPVAEKPPSSFFSNLEQLEFLGLIATAAGLIGSGKPVICNGANLAYRKSAFLSVGGFGDLGSFNDDESLMNRMLHRKIGKIAFAPEAGVVITTQSSNTVLSFLRQRIRWANKRGRYEDKSIFVMLVSLYLFFLSMAWTILLIPFDSQLLLPVILAFSGKVLVDYFTLRSGARMFSQRLSIPHFLVAELLHVPYIVIASAIGQLSALKWKGRTIRR
jgi:cellulose synthase/poly-beta-1,6-N-acetylglucosamine synthase-like glycosyltransferase